MSCILAIVNQKGGVGKTTTAVNVAAYLAERGKRTLLVDLDPQGNASSGLGIERSPERPSSYSLLIDDLPLKETLVQTDRRRLRVCPSSLHLAGAEVELVQLEHREFRLKKALEGVENRFDFVIIDCPPSLGLLTLNALVAADGVIIPVQGEYYALEGVTQLMNTLHLVNQELNPRLEIFGVVITMFDSRTLLAQQVEGEIRQYFEQLAFQTTIPRNVRLSEAPSFGKPINEYDPRSKGAEAYRNLVKEIVKRERTFRK